MAVLGAPNVRAVVDGTTLFLRWADAFNGRDLDGMLACVSESVAFHPLRLNGCHGLYSGHDGVEKWWGQLNEGWLEHWIVLSDTRLAEDGRVLASGSLTLGGEIEIGPFCALYSIEDGLIAELHHYLSDPDMIDHVGLLR